MPTKVVMATADESFRSAWEQRLSAWGCDVQAVTDGLAAWKLLGDENAPRLALLDHRLPGMDGPQICQRIRARGNVPYTYLLLFADHANPQALLDGLHVGADVCLTRPPDENELRLRLHIGMRIVESQERLLATQERIRHHAMHDALTGVWNRAGALDALGRELARAQREQSPVGVLWIDLDHFKNINDTHGHLAGDEVLRVVVERMARVLRPYDVLGRYGGEEFLVVLPECDERCSRKLAERLRQCVGGEVVQLGTATKREVPVTISVGVACIIPGQPTNLETVLQQADDALYRAKHGGRDRVEVYQHKTPGSSQEENVPNSLVRQWQRQALHSAFPAPMGNSSPVQEGTEQLPSCGAHRDRDAEHLTDPKDTRT